MKFFYWADKEDVKLSQMLDSAGLNGIAPSPIGMGTSVKDWHRSLFKQRALFDAVKELDDRVLVCATDGFDVFYQQDAAYIERQFASFDYDVVFSAERGYIHQYRKFRSYFDRSAGSSPYRYINAGSVIGYAGALKKLYRPSVLLGLQLVLIRPYFIRLLLRVFTKVCEMIFLPAAPSKQAPTQFLKWFSYTDQAHLGKSVATGRHGISVGLDRECKLFWCAAHEWEDIDNHCRLVYGKLQNRHTGQTPACIHVPWEEKYRAVFLHLYNMVYGQEQGTAVPEAAQKTLILMADNRNPLVEDYLRAPYYSLAAAINLNYAKRHGYAFRYYLTGAVDSCEKPTVLSDPEPISRRSRVLFSVDLWAMTILHAVFVLLGDHFRIPRALGRRYGRFRNYIVPITGEDPWNRGDKSDTMCHHPKWGPRAAPWSKLLAIKDALSLDYDRIVYIDSDAIFARPAVDLDAFLSASSSNMASIDDAELIVLHNFPWVKAEANSGFMIWRNSSKARQMLEHWWDADAGIYHTQHDYEQHTLIQQLLSHSAEGYRGDIAVIPSVSFLERKGQHIRHVANLDGRERVPRFRFGLRQSDISGEEFARLIHDIAEHHLVSMDPTGAWETEKRKKTTDYTDDTDSEGGVNAQPYHSM